MLPVRDESFAIDPHQRLVRIAALSPDAERVLEQFGVDYWFGGEYSLERACERAAVPVAAVAERLLEISRKHAAVVLSASELIDRINVHHERGAGPAIKQVEERVRRVRLQFHHPQLGQVAQLVRCIEQQWTDHITLGRTLLFPYFQELECAVSTQSPVAQMRLSACWRGRMSLDHTELLADLVEARRLLLTISPEPSTPPLVRAAVDAIRAAEKEVHHHVLLEYQCLFPISVRLEQQVQAMPRQEESGTDS